MELFEQVIKLKAKTNELGYDHSRHMLAQAHVQLAEFYQAEKLLDKAVMHYEQAITLSRLNLDTRKVSENYLHLAFVYAHQKQPKQAADCFYQGYTQYREIISLREGVDFYQQVDPLVVADLAKADEHYRTQNYHIAVGIYMACCDAIMTTSKQLLVAKTTHATVIKKMEQVGNGKGARKRPYEEEAPLVNETEEDCPLTKLQIAKEESYEVTNAYKN
ncbi:MAG: tetratricopeptide repeat protein [Coxiellaceae bacterium]|nr:MAG: tetratricopeptide repeat protein [Coxiellaceae bacterium]